MSATPTDSWAAAHPRLAQLLALLERWACRVPTRPSPPKTTNASPASGPPEDGGADPVPVGIVRSPDGDRIVTVALGFTAFFGPPRPGKQGPA